MKAKEFIPASKPRNFVAKNQKTAGAGAHKDKKKAEKQGDVKHKGKQYDENINEYGDTAKGQKMLTKVQKRAVDRVTSKKADSDPKYAKKNQDTANRAWDRMTDKDESIETERYRDPEDWDEGNTEPPNNMAVYINGKLWKVFQGNGYYADDQREMNQYYKLQDWARKKSEQTGKKWEVSRTGAPATESMEEGWKEKMAAAALAGSMALGAGSAGARTLGSEDPGINRLTGQPVATQVAPSTKDQSASKETIGFSTEYLRKVANGEHPRPMIGKEDAKKELERRGESW